MGLSRHTDIGNGIARSLGITGNKDLVVELRPPDRIVIRQEPVGRRLKRGEKLPEVEFSAQELWELKGNAPNPHELVDSLIARLPVVKFEETDPKKVPYEVKTTLLRLLKGSKE